MPETVKVALLADDVSLISSPKEETNLREGATVSGHRSLNGKLSSTLRSGFLLHKPLLGKLATHNHFQKHPISLQSAAENLSDALDGC